MNRSASHGCHPKRRVHMATEIITPLYDSKKIIMGFEMVNRSDDNTNKEVLNCISPNGPMKRLLDRI